MSFTYKFYGFDTETDDMGYPVILATNTEYTIVKDFSSVLRFLGQKKYRSTIFWTWNLTFDAEGLIKLCLKEFASENWREAAKQMQEGEDKEAGIKGGFSFIHPIYGHVNIFYIKSKFLSISMNKHLVKFYDIAQFFGHKSLESQAQQFLKVGKEDLAGWVEEVKKAQNGEIDHKQLMRYLFENYDDVGYYCMKDAELTLKLSEIMKNAFESAEIPFKNPMSQAKISEEYVKSLRNYPTIPETGKIHEFHEKVEYAFHGGMFETVQRGYFDQEIWDYDINSAYPSSMSTFDHWGNGEFKDVETYTDGVRFGWYLAEFDCKYIPYEDLAASYQIEYKFLDYSEEELIDIAPNARIVYPVGKRVQFITRPELNFMLKHNFRCKVIGGIEWEKTQDKYESPFKWVKEKYELRQQIKQADKDDMRQYALKILLNSTYGKTAQQKPFKSQLTNFFYASYITAETRMKIAEVAINHEKDVIDIATDGICLTCECPELDVSESELGKWERTYFKGALFVGSGIRQMFYDKPDKKGNTFESHARGLTNDPNYDIKGEMEKHLHEDCLRSVKKRPLHLNECIAHNKLLNLEDVNLFRRVEKKLNVNTDKKHRWTREYVDFEDFLQHKTRGKPFNVKDLQGSGN